MAPQEIIRRVLSSRGWAVAITLYFSILSYQFMSIRVMGIEFLPVADLIVMADGFVAVIVMKATRRMI